MKKHILFLIIASYTPYILFGHLKGFFGWEFAFIFFTVAGVSVAHLQERVVGALR